MTLALCLKDDNPVQNRSAVCSMEQQAEQFRKDVLRKENIFGVADVTVGLENELQAAVLGSKEQVDLAVTIEQSNYFRNLVQRAQRGDMPHASVTELRQFLDENREQVWENSWVRFPRYLLSAYADKTLRHDLLADKSFPDGPARSDRNRFLINIQGEEWLRIPVSYLLKLSLADAVSQPEQSFPLFLRTGKRLMRHLISDNISPEITSFSVTDAQDRELPGTNAARETSRRFFIVQLLIRYANHQFKLREHGQTCHLYFAPNPPLRQKRINDLVSIIEGETVNNHQYIVRDTGEVVTEKLIGDRSVRLLYNRVREHAPSMFNALTSSRMSSLLGYFHFDLGLDQKRGNGLDLLNKMGADWHECVDSPHTFDTPRKVFERKIRYWDVRPMDEDTLAVVSPADAKVLIGSLGTTPALFIKEKVFSAAELLGAEQGLVDDFEHGDFAVFRLTPDKYHYNHLPVSGKVLDTYELEGRYHSCNPEAVLAMASLYAKNKRVVTIIDTDVEEGSRVGLVAMIEVVALMIGDIVQCYSNTRYDDPLPVKPGMFVEKGCPKSLYRPGSSTDILLFQPGRLTFSNDLRMNACRRDVQSRFSSGLNHPLVETDIKVRSNIGRASRSSQLKKMAFQSA